MAGVPWDLIESTPLEPIRANTAVRARAIRAPARTFWCDAAEVQAAYRALALGTTRIERAIPSGLRRLAARDV